MGSRSIWALRPASCGGFILHGRQLASSAFTSSLIAARRKRGCSEDLIVTAVYLGVTLSIVGFVFGAPIGTLVATSGVVAIILGWRCRIRSVICFRGSH